MRIAQNYLLQLIVISIFVSLTACGGGSGGDGDGDSPGPVNNPPTVNAGADQTVTEGVTVQLSGTGSDTEGAVTFAWSQTSGTAVTLGSSTSALTSFQAPDVDANTQLAFSLTVTDSSGLTVSDNVVITVQDSVSINTPPTANAGVDQTVNEDANVTLSGSGADAEGSIIYLWTQTAGVAVVINNDNMATANFTAPSVSAENLLTFELTVTDEGGLSASDSIDIIVSDVVVPPATGFNRRVKTLRYDLDFNGVDDAVQIYTYNANNTVDSSTYSYTDDGVADIEFDKFPFNVGDENETQTFTYNANNDVSNWDLVKSNSSFNLEFTWNSPGKISTSLFNVFANGSLQSSINFSIGYASGLVSNVQGSGSSASIDLDLNYDANGVLQSDLQTLMAGGTTQTSQRDFTWNANGAIENIFEFDPDPANNIEDNTIYSYENDRLTKVINDSTGNAYAWNYSYDADGLLQSITIDLGNDGTFNAKIDFEWEVEDCEETILWLLRGVAETSKRLTDTLPYTLGDGHFAIPVCGNVVS